MGVGEARTISTTVLRLCGQSASAPSGVAAQSNAWMRSAISPAPLSQDDMIEAVVTALPLYGLTRREQRAMQKLLSGGQIPMDESHGHRPFSDGRRAALHRPVAYISR